MRETRYVQLRATFINKTQKIIMFFNDITKIKELEKISHKVRAMFLSSVAHELRTPLNSIIPMTTLLRKHVLKDPQALKYVDIISSSSVHLQNVIEDALDMSRIENNKFETQIE